MAIEPHADIAHDRPLSEEDLAAFTLKASLWNRLEHARAEAGKPAESYRVLDWGCGRGKTVLWLRERGFDAYGVDIDPRPVANGRPLCAARGFDAERVLTVLDSRGKCPYPDDFFDFTLSDQVFEHVEDIDTVARELARVTKPGGAGVHIFPARFYPVEGHLYMPFVHWLPKGQLRRAAIHAMVRLGVFADLPSYRGLDARARAEKFFRFSVEQTYYRPVRDILRAMEEAGLQAWVDTASSPTVQARRIGRIAGQTELTRGAFNWLLTRFVSVHLFYRKP